MANSNRTIANMSRKMIFVGYECFYDEDIAETFAFEYRANDKGNRTKITHSKKFGNWKVWMYEKEEK